MNDMPTRKLGELEVGAQGLGCMGMSQSYGKRDDTESIATIHRALDLGVNLLDTANVYGAGENEKLVGKAIANRRDEVVLATKFGIIRDGESLHVRGDAAYVRQCCVESLERLQVDHIDLYYQHRVDPDIPVEETFGALAELVAEGKVRYVGMSEASAESLRRANAVHPVTALQSEWSLWTRDIEDEVLGVCRELGVGIVPFSPLGRGQLTDALSSLEDLPSDDARRSFPRFDEENFARNQAAVLALRSLAESLGVTTGQLALAWVLRQGDDVVPIPGTKRRGYLEENVAALHVDVSDEHMQSIVAAVPRDSVSGQRYPEQEARTTGR